MDVMIGDCVVGRGKPCFIVAEVGINHNGDVALAKQMIDEAARAGCNAVKFQKRTVDVVYPPGDLAKQRQVPPYTGIMQNAVRREVLSQEAVERLVRSNYEDTLNSDLKYALELTRDEYHEIDCHARERGILWFASPWDVGSVDFLEEFNPPCYKVASACITDQELLERLRATSRTVILSTGMSTQAEVARAVEIIGTDKIVLLHTISEYPVRQENDLNLRVMETISRWYPKVPVGYSGHEADILPSIVAVALGAVVVERHFTLSRNLWGTDQQASIVFQEMRELVEAACRIPNILGNGEKVVTFGELEIMRKLRRKYLY